MNRTTDVARKRVRAGNEDSASVRSLNDLPTKRMRFFFFFFASVQRPRGRSCAGEAEEASNSREMEPGERRLVLVVRPDVQNNGFLRPPTILRVN